MNNSEKSPKPPRIEPGSKVRVRSGATSPDLKDLPLGGWTGTVKVRGRFEDQVAYEVEWDRKTIDAMQPAYRERCKRAGLEPESQWLAEADVELDDGTPPAIDQPVVTWTSPLSEKDQDDRVRKALGLTHDDPIPDLSPGTLLAYHRYLAAHLTFPFHAHFGAEVIGPYSRKRGTMRVTGLLDPERVSVDEWGLVCTVRLQEEEIEVPLADIEVGKKSPNRKLISDYSYWYSNWPYEDEDEWESESDREDGDPAIGLDDLPQGLWIQLKMAFIIGGGSAALGATIGAAFKTLNGAVSAATIGGVVLGLLGALIFGLYGSIVGAVNRFSQGALAGGLLGALGGGLVGMVLGLMFVALPWSFVGLTVGILLGLYLSPVGPGQYLTYRAVFLGTCGGILFPAFRQDQARATAGSIAGAIAGLVLLAGLILLPFGLSYLSRFIRKGQGQGGDDKNGGPQETNRIIDVDFTESKDRTDPNSLNANSG